MVQVFLGLLLCDVALQPGRGPGSARIRLAYMQPGLSLRLGEELPAGTSRFTALLEKTSEGTIRNFLAIKRLFCGLIGLG